jgi:hypothetical protein
MSSFFAILTGNGQERLRTGRSNAMHEPVFLNKEVSARLEIGDSTLRKWSMSLENAGYQFIKKEKGDITIRVYRERDVTAFLRYKELIQSKVETMDSVSKIIVSEFGEGMDENDQERTGSLLVTDTFPTPLSVYEVAFQTFIERQNEVNREWMAKQQELIDRMKQRVDDQQKYIQETLEKRDHALMGTIRELMEQRRIEAAEQNQSFWRRLFKK